MPSSPVAGTNHILPMTPHLLESGTGVHPVIRIDNLLPNDSTPTRIRDWPSSSSKD